MAEDESKLTSNQWIWTSLNINGEWNLHKFIKSLIDCVSEAVDEFSCEHSGAHVSACGMVFLDDVSTGSHGLEHWPKGADDADPLPPL